MRRLSGPACVFTLGLLALLAGCTFSDYVQSESASVESSNRVSERPVLTAAPDSPIVTFEPRFLSYQPPTYPRLAQQAGLEGEVILQVRIDAKGTPDEVTVVRSSGTSSLDAAAVEAAYGCQYVPAKQETTAVPFTVRYLVAFRLTR